MSIAAQTKTTVVITAKTTDSNPQPVILEANVLDESAKESLLTTSPVYQNANSSSTSVPPGNYARAQVESAKNQQSAQGNHSFLSGGSNDNSQQDDFSSSPDLGPTDVLAPVDSSSNNLIAFSDEDSKNQYAILRKFGLNPLRGELLAAIEFMPIASENSIDFNRRDDNDPNTQNITKSIAKIIELHRQIREYLVRSAVKVYEKTFPMYKKQTSPDTNSDTNTDPSAQLAENFISNVTAYSAGYIANVLAVQDFEETGIQKIEDLTHKIVESAKSSGGATDLPKRAEMLGYIESAEDEFDILFLRGVIEFCLYKIFALQIIASYITLYQEKEKPKQQWQIDVGGVKSFSSLDIETLLSNASQDTTNFFRKSKFFNQEIADFYRDELGLVKSAVTKDTFMLYQTLFYLYSQIRLSDSVRSFDSLKSLSPEDKLLTDSILKTAVSNDMKDAFSQLTSYEIQDFISYLGSNTGYVRLGKFNNQNIFDKDRFRNIGTQISSNVGTYTSEMLAAYAFDFCINLNSSRRVNAPSDSTNNTNFLFSSFGPLTYDQYTEKVLLGEYPLFEALGYGSPSVLAALDYGELLEKQTTGPLLLGNTAGTSYLEFYKQNKINIYESGITGGDTVNKPGAEYVFETITLPKKLQDLTGQTGLIESDKKEVIDTTFDHYRDASARLLNDLGSLFPDYGSAEASAGTISKSSPIGRMSPKHRIKSLLLLLADDIDNIIANPEKFIPLLSVFLSQNSFSQSSNSVKKAQLKTFLALFWGFIDSHKYRQLLNLQGTTINENKRKIISGVISGLAHFYNEDLLQDFLEKVGVTIPDNNKYTRGFHGGQHAKALKLFTSEYSSIEGFDKTFKVFLTDDPPPGNPFRNDKSTFLPNVINLPEVLTSEVSVGNKNTFKDKLNVSYTGNPNKALHEVYYNKDLADTSNKRYFGLFRLFEKSFSAVCADLDFSDIFESNRQDGVITDLEETIAMFEGFEQGTQLLPTWKNDALTYKSSLGPLKLKMHHKALVWYKWMTNMLVTSVSTRGIKAKVEVKKPTGNGNGSLKIKYSLTQLTAIKEGLIEAAENIESVESLINAKNEMINEANEDLVEQVLGGGGFSQDISVAREAKKHIFDSVIKVCRAIEKREKNIATLSSVFLNHSIGMKSSYESGINTNDVLSGTSSKLALLPLTETIDGGDGNNVVANWLASGLTTVNKHSIVSIINSMNKYFDTNKNRYFMTNYAMTTEVNKVKYMYKILTADGYGFLSNNEEKRGRKTIMSVGIPAGMIDVLRKNAYQESGNQSFLSANHICISVHKKSHLEENVTYDPKHFIFDTSIDIADRNLGTGERANHIKNFSSEYSLNKLLNITELSRFVDGINPYVPFVYVLSEDDPTVDFRSDRGKEMLMNHAIDYSLKEYLRLTIGVDMSEECFIMDLGQDNFESSSSLNLDRSKEEEFENVLRTLTNAYPQIDSDPQLRNEVFRLTNLIKQMPPFSNRQNYIKSISPRKFDKVYSLIVNEKDFTLAGNPDIFENTVDKGFGSKLEINSSINLPKLLAYTTEEFDEPTGQFDVDEFLGSLNSSGNELKKLSNYVRSLNENAPEVYNYSISISLVLPDFETISS